MKKRPRGQKGRRMLARRLRESLNLFRQEFDPKIPGVGCNFIGAAIAYTTVALDDNAITMAQWSRLTNWVLGWKKTATHS